ncbi:MAG: flagellar motor protein MotB [Candidatus Omnitrophota bacterium]
MIGQKKNKSNNLRAVRKGLRSTVSGEVIDVEKGWPPPWVVSWADMVTNLMCFFIMWYALTIMKYPKEFISYKATSTGAEAAKAREIIKAYEILLQQTKIDKIAAGDKIEELSAQTQKSSAVLVGLRKFLDENSLSSKVDLNLKGDEIVITPLDDLFFDKGKADIKPQNQLLLERIAAIFRANPAMIKIEGYTDDTPILPFSYYKYSDNWQLSTARAVSVARFLIDKQGITPQMIMVSGYGPLKPVAPNSDSLNRAKNRRVEIHMVIGNGNSGALNKNNNNKKDEKNKEA